MVPVKTVPGFLHVLGLLDIPGLLVSLVRLQERHEDVFAVLASLVGRS